MLGVEFGSLHTMGDTIRETKNWDISRARESNQ